MAKKSQKSRNLSVYSNLTHNRKAKKDSAARKRAEYLATLPKHPVKRTLYRLHPKRLAAYWFSKQGAITALKIGGISALVVMLGVGTLFAYYRKDLDRIRPGEIAKRVQTTVTKYYDRNDQLLWEDKGEGNYKLVVPAEKMPDVLKKATIAIEDRDFYRHNGVSPIGIMRAMFNNLKGGSTQGGSTLTQQLVKQVFFADEASDRSLGGVPRKIKELILSVEVERMYDKNQILALYLNESPYGGRRNGVQSAAQTYFGKDVSNISLPEAALLASIPNQPGLYDPYNTAGHEALIARQHKVLDSMVDTDMITQEEADKAKEYPILDSIKPLVDQNSGIDAPHFVLMVRAQLEKELGKATVGQGGLTVKTTLDKRIQDKLEAEMDAFFATGIPERNAISNGAATIEDTETGQIIAMVGSRDFNYPGFGQDNAATAYIQPGSTVKPFVFAELFKNKGADAQNFGTGSILKDEPIDDLYGAKLQNHDGRFMGNITIRTGLALSRNVPAVKAMYVSGVTPTIKTIREVGSESYCKPEEAAGVGLSAAIGGCSAKQIEMVNAYATLARGGTYKPTASILEVRNSQNEVLKKWKDESKKVLDPQITYIISDILADQSASAPLHGFGSLAVPGVKTAAKTGTSDRGTKPKDLWTMTYSPVLAMGVWFGNSDTSNVLTSNSAIGQRIISNTMQYAHQDIYAAEGKWKSGDWMKEPADIQRQGKELYPSWWNKNQNQTYNKMTFDRVSKKRATDCTPDAARIEIDVVKTKDPVTKKDVFRAPDGYKPGESDDVHNCGDTPPSIASIDVSGKGPTHKVEVVVRKGTHPLATLDVLVDGSSIGSASVSGSGTHTFTYKATSSGEHTVTANIRDSAYYTGSSSDSFSSDSSSTSTQGSGERGRDFRRLF